MYLLSARPHYEVTTNFPMLVFGETAGMHFLSSSNTKVLNHGNYGVNNWLCLLSAGREGSVIKVSINFRQELLISCQLSVLLYPGIIITSKFSG